ncbi:MAG: helix-turn-helix domain-containing protein [Anaerolineales bacterium]|nr:helix-turn-helix domain-containing protein [Anaerolineales bacterium]
MIISTTIQAIRKTRRTIIAEFFAKGKQSLRALGKRLNCSKSTVHRHLKETAALRHQHPEAAFWETKTGEAWLRLLIFTVLYKIGIQHTVGADALSDSFKMIRINDHVGVSPSALHTQLNQMEDLGIM